MMIIRIPKMKMRMDSVVNGVVTILIAMHMQTTSYNFMGYSI